MQEATVYSIAELMEKREECAAAGDYAGAKRANREIMEREMAEGCEKVHYYPPRLQLEHNNTCNARCIMCSHFFTQNDHPLFMGEEQKGRIRPLLPYLEKITLHGVGEPLAHPEIADYIEWYHSYGIRVGCNTNLSVMNEKLARAIHKAFTGISISCDGASRETYEGIRRGLSFDRFCENARMLRSFGSGLKMRMHTVAMRQNLPELPDLVRLAHELGCSHITIVDLSPQDFLDNRKDSAGRYLATAQKYIGEAVRTAEELGISISYPRVLMELKPEHTAAEEEKEMAAFPRFPSEAFGEELKEKFRNLELFELFFPAEYEDLTAESGYHCEGICDYFAAEPYIDVRGNLFLCCIDWMHSLGNLGEQPFEEIWNGRIYRGLRRLFRNGDIPRYCRGCLFLRNKMFTPHIRVTDMDRGFFDNAFDGEVRRRIRERLESHAVHSS